jgi:predicted nucleic acid-binding protein
VILDTSVVVAFMNRSDRRHQEVVDWLDDYQGSLVTSPLAVAEMDHLVGRLGGAQAQLALWEDFDRGAYRVEWWPAAMYETIEVAREHAGFERHFRILQPLGGEDSYRLFPADRG